LTWEDYLLSSYWKNSYKHHSNIEHSYQSKSNIIFFNKKQIILSFSQRQLRDKSPASVSRKTTNEPRRKILKFITLHFWHTLLRFALFDKEIFFKSLNLRIRKTFYVYPTVFRHNAIRRIMVCWKELGFIFIHNCQFLFSLHQ
jgi:hypothetical protein